MTLIELWTLAVFKRDHNLCQRCRTLGYITLAHDAHHIIHKDSEKHGFLRYHLDNGVALCRACHDLDAQGRLREWCEGYIGEDRYYELKRMAHESLGKPFDEDAKRRELATYLDHN
jgi:hypothetical protein